MQKKPVVLLSSLKEKKNKREAKSFNTKSQLATLRPYLFSSYPAVRTVVNSSPVIHQHHIWNYFTSPDLENMLSAPVGSGGLCNASERQQLTFWGCKVVTEQFSALSTED